MTNERENTGTSKKEEVWIHRILKIFFSHTPPYFTTTVWPLKDLAASEIVSAISEKFSGTALRDKEDVNDAGDDDAGEIKPDAPDSSKLNTVTIVNIDVNDFMMAFTIIYACLLHSVTDCDTKKWNSLLLWFLVICEISKIWNYIFLDNIVVL